VSLPTPPPSILVERGDELVLTRRWLAIDVLFLGAFALFSAPSVSPWRTARCRCAAAS
jgi:hypothetical protein